MPTPNPGSATPEGKPTAREVAHKHVSRCYTGDARWSIEAAQRHSPACDRLTAAIEQDRATRDALHAEALAKANADYFSASNRRQELVKMVEDARAALQHGEERERVLREALELLASPGMGPLCGCFDTARRALATAQAMKEAAK